MPKTALSLKGGPHVFPVRKKNEGLPKKKTVSSPKKFKDNQQPNLWRVK